MTGDVVGAKVSSAQCPECKVMRPVDLSPAWISHWDGTLDTQLDAATAAVAAEHPDHDRPGPAVVRYNGPPEPPPEPKS